MDNHCFKQSGIIVVPFKYFKLGDDDKLKILKDRVLHEATKKNSDYSVCLRVLLGFV